jgi:tetratricopeptide (TPR) repeat protein
MTRIVVTAAMIALLTVFVGCQENQGRSQMLPQRDTLGVQGSPPVPVEVAAAADEIDLVEQLATQRQAYQRSLETLIKYYETSGNNDKLTWARTELQALDRIPQYRYIVESQRLPADLKATAKIQAADDLYAKAMETERKAGVLPVLKDEQLLRAALNQYSQLISQYPTSDKIDDAAFRMGGIHEYFKDYVIALSFYQRAYQWDPATPNPARFKAAFILDWRLHRRAEALQLYQEAIVKEAQFTEYKATAERRIQDLSSSDKPTQ